MDCCDVCLQTRTRLRTTSSSCGGCKGRWFVRGMTYRCYLAGSFSLICGVPAVGRRPTYFSTSGLCTTEHSVFRGFPSLGSQKSMI
jgi:hypothetical protein